MTHEQIEQAARDWAKADDPEFFRPTVIAAYIAGFHAALKSEVMEKPYILIKRLIERNRVSEIADTQDYYRGKRGDDFASDVLKNIMYGMEAALQKYEQLIKRPCESKHPTT